MASITAAGITPHPWFAGRAEEAAPLYVWLLPGRSRGRDRDGLERAYRG